MGELLGIEALVENEAAVKTALVNAGVFLKSMERLDASSLAVRTELAAALDALRELHDLQNGPPLIRDTARHAAAMKSAITILKRNNA